METVTVITQSQHQSIELPVGFQLDANEVYLKRVGRSVLLIPIDANPWDLMSGSLNDFTNDFMEDRDQPPEQKKVVSFDSANR